MVSLLFLQVSSLKPKTFHEFLVRVYYDPKNQEDQEVQQKAEEYFHKWCKDNEEFIDFGTDAGNSNSAAISSLCLSLSHSLTLSHTPIQNDKYHKVKRKLQT